MKNRFLGVLVGLAGLGIFVGSNLFGADKPAEKPVAQKFVFVPGPLTFDKATVYDVLDFYQDLSGRTVLSCATLPLGEITIRETVKTQGETIKLLDAALAKAKVKVVLEGEKFVYAVPADSQQKLPKFDAKAMTEKLGSANEVYKPGLVRLADCLPKNFLQIYAALARRNPLQVAENTPQVAVNFSSQTDLTRAEAVFALEAIAAVNGLEFKMVGQDGVTLGPAGKSK